ncbi:MAG: nuclear transport factor 2 family protein, partial [Actinobacteria bacterium]|nr:nuclear transport factor 2 family protein [Actinomycetota bacterium]
MTTYPAEEVSAALAAYVALRDQIAAGQATWTDLAELFTEDAVYIDPAWGRLQGKENLLEFF